MKKTKKRRPRRRRFGTIIDRAHASGATVWLARWFEGRTGPRRERTFDSHREAVSFLTDIEKKLAIGSYVVPPRADDPPGPPVASSAAPGFVEYARKTFDEKIAPSRAEATVQLNQANLRALSGFFGPRMQDGKSIPGKRLDEVTRSLFEHYIAWRRHHRSQGPADRPVSNAAINRDAAFLSVILGHAVLDGHLPANPLAGMKSLKEPKRGRRSLSKPEAARLLKACDPHFRAFVLGGLLTGARPAELRSLTWSAIDFEGKKVYLDRAKVGNSDALDLHPRLEEELLRLRGSRPGVKGEDRVFLNRRGEPWRDMRRAWKRALKGAGLDKVKDLTPYSLRTSFATHFLENSGSVSDLQSQLGHADISTTNLYVRLVDQRRKKTILAMDLGTDEEPQVHESPRHRR